MEVLVTSLDALLHKATNATLERPDAAALEAFCTVLGDSPNGPYIATRVIASRIRSQHPTEALLALEVLDSCMKRCESTFHAEVDKFRFLNEMIKLVSPKYYGNKTAPAVRQKVLTLMHNWTIDYPREIKIRDAYEMLKKQGVVKDNPPPTPPTPVIKPRNKDNIFEDEEKSKMLQKLLQSKNPDDLQAANRLIKTMVREGERRNEAVTRRITELQTVQNNVHLLDEMLEQYRPNTSSQEDLELIKELYIECGRFKPTIFKIASETHQNEDMLNEVLEIGDELEQVLDKYTAIIIKGVSFKSDNKQSRLKVVNGNNASLLDFAMPLEQTDENPSKPEAAFNKNYDLETLDDIFSSVENKKEPCDSNIESVQVLKPVSIASSHGKDSKIQLTNKGLEELDVLGEELLKLSLPPSCKLSNNFNSQKMEKLSLNSIGKKYVQTTENDRQNDNLSKHLFSDKTSKNTSDMLNLDFLISKTLESEKNLQSLSSHDDAMVDISSDDNLIDSKPRTEDEMSLVDYMKNTDRKVNDRSSSSSIENIDNRLKVSESKKNACNSSSSEIKNAVESKQVNDIKSLANIDIALDSIKPANRSPITIFEEDKGLTTVLHFTENKPRPDTSVVVISTSSRHVSPISDFKFQAVVPKGYKVRLLHPSGTSFPQFNPFLPPAAITQVMLIGSPANEASQILLKFVINYVCQEDTVSEIGEVQNLQLN